MDVMEFLRLDEKDMFRKFIMTYGQAKRELDSKGMFTLEEVNQCFQLVEGLRCDLGILGLFLAGDVALSPSEDGEVTVTLLSDKADAA
jgi:hypothetical protein